MGGCLRCGDCCHFTYWVNLSHPEKFPYYLDYAYRFFDKKDVIARQLNANTWMIEIRSIYCLQYDPETRTCCLHGNDKPKECRNYPRHWEPLVFEQVRCETCGFHVVYQ